MPFKSAAQAHVEELQEQLRQRDQQIANMMLEKADDAVNTAKQAADAEQQKAQQKVVEEARRKAWVLHRFDQRVAERPHDTVPLDQIFSDPPADGSWPPNDGPENWRVGANTDAASAEVATQSVADTALGRALKSLEESHARIIKQA